MNRKEAQTARVRFYTSGRPCALNHEPLRRYTSNGSCVVCSAYACRQLRKDPADRDPGREARLARKRAYYATSRISYSQRYYQNNKARRREQARKSSGLPPALRPCPDACECCGRQMWLEKQGLHLDHDHATGKFRGWLCGRCNRSIGQLGDSVEALELALAYLRRSA